MTAQRTLTVNMAPWSTIGVVFLVLKLVHVIQWSWWLVLLPFYGPIVLLVLVAFLVRGFLR